MPINISLHGLKCSVQPRKGFVYRVWRKALKQHVRDPELQIEMYHMLCSILQELDEDYFVTCVQSFMEYIRQESAEFAAYFASYCSRVKEWVYCYRVDTQANTNMYVGSYHNVLKLVHMERSQKACKYFD